MIDKLVYAQNGVHQCWTCKNRVGKAEYKCSIRGVDGFAKEIICVLPECRMMDAYMTIVYEAPCSKYVYWNAKEE